MANRYHLSSLTKPHVIAAADYFGPKHGITSVGGWRAVGSVPNSDHPKGLALDFMTRNKSVGDSLAADLIASRAQWGITYVIWWRRIWTPEKGWHAYNGPVPHTDHVHASFAAKPGTNGGTASDAGTAVQNVGLMNPFSDFAKLIPALSKVTDTLTSPQTYRDLGFVMIGVACIILGILLLVVGSAGTLTRTVTKSAVKAVVSK